MAETTKVPFGVQVTVPIGGRYHPALLAQAAATLDRMYPGRFMMGVGNGEAVNETHFLGYWPSWKERTERLIEGIALMRRLWTEDDFFEFNGRYFKMKQAFLYLKPTRQIPLYFSGLGEKSARYAGMYGDHLLTFGEPDFIKNKIFPRFQEGLRESKRSARGRHRAIIVIGGIGPTKQLIKRARDWFSGVLDVKMYDESDPRVIEEVAKKISDEEISRGYTVVESGDEMIEKFDEYRKIGLDMINYLDFSPNAEYMLSEFQNKVLPYFKAERE
jgi:coenzyme F420-dependent glucose-6-phosphate dehydrogenase